jgi:TatD DNase family protein
MKFIDTHCHVHFAAYSEDMHEVIKRTLDHDVGMITIGTQTTTSANGIKLAEMYEGIWATIGLHPNHIHAQEFFDTSELPAEKQPNPKIVTRTERFDEDYYSGLVTHPKVVAIGEFGLDYYRIPENLKREDVIVEQKTELKKQLEFATKYDKPIVIHCRDAHQDQYEILKSFTDTGKLQKRGVIHSFTGTIEDAEKYRSIGFSVAFNGIVTFNKELMQVVKQIPDEQLLIETDSPYLTPAPNRGKRNEPKNVIDIAKFIAEQRNCSLDEIAEITTQNAVKLFRLNI